MKWKETLATIVRSRFILGVLVGFVILCWLRYAPPTAPWSPQAIKGYILPEPKIITRIVKETVPGPERIRIVPKKVIVERWHDLPTPATIANENAVVTAVATIPPSPEGGTAVAVLTPNQAGEGVGTIEYQPTPRKFVQFKREFVGEAYYYPVGDRSLEAAVGVLPVRIGPIEVKAKAGIDVMREDSAIRGFVAVGGEIHF